jgi:hypothetical protein
MTQLISWLLWLAFQHWTTDMYTSSSYDRTPLTEGLFNIWIPTFTLPFFRSILLSVAWCLFNSQFLLLLYNTCNCTFRHSRRQLVLGGWFLICSSKAILSVSIKYLRGISVGI